jgi:hypothetical protein
LFIAASARVFDEISEPATLEALACNVDATDCLEVIRNLEEKSLCSYSAILNAIHFRKNLVGEGHSKSKL